MVGGLVTGMAVNRFGRQLCIAASFVFSVGGVFAQFFASTPVHFLAGKFLTGIPMGCFTTVAPTYGSEMAPLKIRGAISAGVNLSIVLGQFIGYGVMRETAYYVGDNQYKILFTTQWGFAGLGILILPFFPE